jgi:uncharacterized protein
MTKTNTTADRNDAAGPLQVLGRLQELIRTGRRDGFAEVMAADGVVEWPFHRKGTPARIEGREGIREFLRSSPMADLIHIEDLRLDAVHLTADPEVVIAETTTAGHVVGTDNSFELRAIAVIRVRDGEIVLYRDYIDPSAGQQLSRSD